METHASNPDAEGKNRTQILSSPPRPADIAFRAIVVALRLCGALLFVAQAARDGTTPYVPGVERNKEPYRTL
jgi:hypothetical protein